MITGRTSNLTGNFSGQPGYPWHKARERGIYRPRRFETHSNISLKPHSLTFKKSWKPFRSVLLFCFLKKTFQITARSCRSHWGLSAQLWVWVVASALVASSTEVMIQTQRQEMRLASWKCQKDGFIHHPVIQHLVKQVTLCTTTTETDQNSF